MENKTFKKVSVFKLSADIREAVKVVEVPLMRPSDDEILVKNLYSGVNATDINITAGRNYFDGKLPFDIGLEVSIDSNLHLNKFLINYFSLISISLGLRSYRSDR
jgi:hypothetical protein